MKNDRVMGTILVGALCLLVCTGCGIPKTKGNTLAAIEQLENLEYDNALSSLDAATEAGENPALIARTRGIACMGLTEYEEAATYFLEALSYSNSMVDDLDYDLNYYLADAYEHMKKFDKAADTYTAIVNLDTKNALAYYKRGAAYLELNNYDNAISDFDRALSLDSDNYDLRIEVAGELFDAGYETEGQQYLNDFLVEKEKKLSKFDKGRIYFYMKDYVNAKQYFEEARDDDDQNTVLFLGKTYEYLGDYNYATSTYQNYLSKHPEAALIYNQLGLSRMQAEDYAGAREAFSAGRAVENNGIDQTLYFNEIVAYEYEGNFTQAAIAMEGYLKKYPEDETAIREYEFLKSR